MRWGSLSRCAAGVLALLASAAACGEGTAGEITSGGPGEAVLDTSGLEIDIPAPLAQFEAMNEWSGGLSHDALIEGTLRIEPPCIYVEERYEGVPTTDTRTLLSLPRTGTFYDSDTRELWVWRNGPFVDGDEISGGGGESHLQSGMCEYEWVFAATRLSLKSDQPEPRPPDLELEACLQTARIEECFYASEYDVTPEEAQRRLHRIQPIQALLAEIRGLEPERLAGWGIDHEGEMTGWVCLSGDARPSAQAQSIADEHSDIEIRIGAAGQNTGQLATREQLSDGQRVFGDFLRKDREAPEGTFRAELARVVYGTGVDMRANAVTIDVDLQSIYPFGANPTRAMLQERLAEAVELYAGYLDVPFIIDAGSDLRAGPGLADFGCSAKRR